MSLNIVPPEILVEILRFLDPSSVYSFSLVNKYLSATATPLLWHSPTLHHEEQFTQFLSSLAMTTKQLGHHVRELNLETPHCPTDEEVLFLIERMPHLETFSSADSHQLTNSSLGKLSHYCPDLQELSLCSAAISYRSMHHLGRCKRLRSLSLKNCEDLIAISLLPLADCPLEYLDLSGCKWLTAEDTAYDIRAFTRLKVLGLMCCQGVTTEFIQCLAQQPNPELTAFSITGCDVNDDGIVSFVKAHPRLEHLTLMDCAITDTSLFAIQNHLGVLHYLEISYCNRITKSGVRHMIRNMPCLGLIGLKNCDIKLRDFPEVETSPNVYWASGIHVDRFTVYELDLVRTAEFQPPTPPEIELTFPDVQIEEIQAEEPYSEVAENIHESYSYIQEYLGTHL
ncbi:hypothetical protein CLU79DRAFT_758305 [Phycomyces nitens]|nr:hypothetical protein CLU79DRAFT_758305 [Phycomyces nitens]